MRPFVIGLTGSIGMGKTTTAQMFADEGLSVWDADAAVHRLYAKGGGAVEAVGALNSDAIVDGAVDRSILKQWISVDADALGQIESVVHPLVAKDRADFLENCATKIAVVDIPLLFETGAENHVDLVIVVSAPPEIQRERVLERPGMTAEMFEIVLSKQMPDSEKRDRADFIVPTETLEGARDAVQVLVRHVREQLKDA